MNMYIWAIGTLEARSRVWENFSQLKFFRNAEAVAQRCTVEKMFLEISQNSQENTCTKVSFFTKVVGLRPATLSKRRPRHRYSPVNFVKFLRTTFITEHLRFLLLEMMTNAFYFTLRALFVLQMFKFLS